MLVVCLYIFAVNVFQMDYDILAISDAQVSVMFRQKLSV